MGNPIEDFAAEEGLTKEAGWLDSKRWEHPLVGVGAAIATPLLLAGASEGYGAIKHSIQKARGFKQMVEQTPDLQSRPAKELKSRYSAFYNISPTIMGDPVTAAGIMTGLDTYGGLVHPKTLGELAEAENRMHRPLPPVMQQVMSGASQAASRVPMDMSNRRETKERADMETKKYQLAESAHNEKYPSALLPEQHWNR